MQKISLSFNYAKLVIDLNVYIETTTEIQPKMFTEASMTVYINIAETVSM